MDGPLIYLCTLSGISMGLMVVRIARYPRPNREIIPRRIIRHMDIPYCLDRHRFMGPWTRKDVLILLTSLAMNVAAIVFPHPKNMVSRVANMALYNMVFICLFPNLNTHAELLGISIASSRKLHRLLASMMGGNLFLHILLALIPGDTGFSIKSARGIWGIGVRDFRNLLFRDRLTPNRLWQVPLHAHS